MPIGLGDIVGQIGTGVYRLIKGKDVNIKAGANVTASGDGQFDDATVSDITIQPGDLILVDDVSVSYPDGAAGASGSVTGGGGQASTMTTSFASVWTFIQGQAGSGNDGLVPSAGSLGQFLAYNGTWATPPDTNTMGSGFTVSATTDTTATTITQGDDLFFAAGTGISCETTADGTVTITNTSSGGTISSVANATDNYVATFSGSSTLNGEEKLQFNGAQLDVRGDIWVRDENDNTDPGELVLSKARLSSGGNLVGLNNDNIGLIKFQSYNDTPAVKTFSEIVSQISDATAGQEAGRLEFKVAEYDGTLTTGLKIEGDTDADGEVDVTIGAGAACTTTINGVVNLPNAAAGSVSSGDHLGLDGSGNIVKTTGGSAGVTLSGSIANGIATYNTTNELTIEPNLRYDSDELLFSPTLGGSTIKLKDATSGTSAGKSFRFTSSNAVGTDQVGGEVRISSGRGTGDKGGGDIDFFGSQIGQSSGSTSNTPKRMLQIAGATANVQIDNTNFPNAGFVGNNIGLVHDDALYLTPGDFNITSVSRSDGDVFSNDNGGSIRPNSATHNYHAFTYVPLGYKITHVQVQGSGGTFEVYTGLWSNDSTQQEGSQTAIGSTLDLSSSPWTSIAGKYVVIIWDPASQTNELYGAKITLTRV